MGMRTGAGTGAGTGTGESERFARLMRELKERAGLSYGALARNLHTSTSTLHRYCNGEAVPTEFAVVDRFARVCGASQGEAVDLHRAWLLADARRRAGAAGAGVPQAVPLEAEASGGAAEAPPEPAGAVAVEAGAAGAVAAAGAAVAPPPGGGGGGPPPGDRAGTREGKGAGGGAGQGGGDCA
ncbi:helix-turn-helix domain-containing protein, partial [Streptomyces sp. NPDC058728]|uniref:helix-turn-helix domain-containing protein n=1 Tax=Streptomyces sp. NPDC058728 TaxID=3346612 RepID=UPI0036A00DC2